MTTSIQLDEETKKKLFNLKLDLEKERGQPVTYNELIEYLLEEQRRTANRSKNLKEFRKLKGTLPKDTLKYYFDEKRKELDREERLAPLNSR